MHPNEIKSPPDDSANRLTEAVVGLLVRRVDSQSLPGRVEALAKSMGMGGVEVGRVIEDARRMLTLAATVNRDEKFAEAVSRLNDLYTLSHAAEDYRTAMAAQKELNRLYALYRPPAEKPAESLGGEDRETIEAMRAHLEPLGLAPAGAHPIELARLASERIIGGNARSATR